MTREQIAEIGKDHYADMVRLGWIDKELSNSHYLMLIIGEVCEAIQADRKGNVTVSQSVSWDILRTEVDEMDSDLLFKESFEYYCKDTVQDELADTMLRLLSFYYMKEIDKLIPYDVGYRYLPVPDENTFTENAMKLVRILSQENALIAACDGIAYVNKWAEKLNIDLYKACKRKMRYNRIRTDWKYHVKKY
jgi:NTP pyrophosphatase (non-canonical NTP hydrolase)